MISIFALPFVSAAALFGTVVPSAAAQRFTQDTAVFAGGCFWGIEGVFRHVKGVTSATSGYAGGSVAAPSYEQVGTGTTGHAESVLVTYDPAQVSYAQLLDVFFMVAHDPTQRNRQGPDVGTQYRSIAFYRDSAQHRIIETYIATLKAKQVFPAPIATEVKPLEAFYPAEAYHQNYMALHPRALYIVYHDVPKVKNLKRVFPALYREPPKS
jgi:peptide-methionine (S)-S-oxide reductase